MTYDSDAVKKLPILSERFAPVLYAPEIVKAPPLPAYLLFQVEIQPEQHFTRVIGALRGAAVRIAYKHRVVVEKETDACLLLKVVVGGVYFVGHVVKPRVSVGQGNIGSFGCREKRAQCA